MPVLDTIGFGRSAKATDDSIGTGETDGSIVDLMRPYGFVKVRILDCANIAASTKLRLNMGATDDDTLCRVYDFNKDSQDLASLPTSGSFEMVIPAAMGGQRIQAILSVAAEGAISIEYYGLDPIVE